MEQNAYHYQIAARDIDGPIVFQYCYKADLTNDAEGDGSSLNSETGTDSLSFADEKTCLYDLQSVNPLPHRGAGRTRTVTGIFSQR